jgi:SAM-dependent methyltransferase
MEQVQPKYYRNQRKPLSTHIPPGAHSVLDVGCGAGHFGAYLKESGKAARVFGIELLPEAAQEARAHLDKVVCANLDTYDLVHLPEDLGLGSFDYIVCADVLEHVKDPWTKLAGLGGLLKPEGKVIVSVPNVRHWSVILPLVARGRWDYQSEGIMDQTHLRFFTHSTASELIERAGFSVSKSVPQIGGRWKSLSRISLGLADEFLAIQYVFVASQAQRVPATPSLPQQ